ncbi:hypothetical protein KP509_36G001800 [Ceratopteris richardii]|nr:hypothetical protein KP509_36G001800 [Ceratopteris richardii]
MANTTTSSKPTIAANRENLSFLVVGDWGREGLYNQTLVAQQMGKIGGELGTQFVVSTGDNFYNSGLSNVSDPTFTYSFTDVYTASSLQTTWYAVLGNHDYKGNVLAQLSDDIVTRDWRWFCRRSFQLNFTMCNGSSAGSCNATLDMFFFDTTPFIDEYWTPEKISKFNWTGLAPREEQLQLQLDELREGLNTSSATWKIVVGHHTIRSVGNHGDYAELVEKLLPILEEFKVNAYINGHDHNLQHILRQDSTVNFFTSGGGSKSYAGLQAYTEEQGVRFARDGQGFLAVTVDSDSMSFSFYDVFGDELYSFVLGK